MVMLSDFTGPGYICIQSQPKPGCEDECRTLYESERGRLGLQDDCFSNGGQYRSTEDPSICLATYDLREIYNRRYTMLSERRSPQEQEVIDHKLNFHDRRIYSDISTRGHVEGPAPIMMSVAFVVKDEHVDEVHRWYEEEHTNDLMQIPGWLRSRRFQLVAGDGQKPGCIELLAVHEFAKDNALDGKEHQLAKSRKWRNRVLDELVESRKNQRYEFMHELSSSDHQKPAKATTLNDSSHILSNAVHQNFAFLCLETRGCSTSAEASVTIDLLTSDPAQSFKYM